MKTTLRRQIRLWAEVNEPSRAVECAVKLWEFLRVSNSISKPFQQKSGVPEVWINRGLAEIWERINENEQNK